MPNQDVFQKTMHKSTLRRETAKLDLNIEFLVREYYPYIHRLALSILNDIHEADDVAQDTFIAAHHSMSGFRYESNPKTWLSSIAINASRGRLRKRKVREILTNTLQAIHLLNNSPSSPELVALQNESDTYLWKLVDGLDEKHRLPVILRYVHDLNAAEIANILHISQGTVHSRLHYARRKLYAQLGHLNPGKETSDEISD
jgi:RNA polymerase sigma-70 factor (ECF subfamily)